MRLFTKPDMQLDVPGASIWQQRLAEERARAARSRRDFLVVAVAVDAGRVLSTPAPQTGGRVLLLRAPCETVAGAQAAGSLNKAESAVIAGGLRRAVRGSDVVCRLAESRFGLLLLDTDPQFAYPTCIRLMGQVRMEVATRVPSLQGFGLHFGYAVSSDESYSPALLGIAAERELGRRWSQESHDSGA